VVNDGADKAVQIWNVTGRRPILAAGNSNGDLEMLAFTGGPSLPALRKRNNWPRCAAGR
jgi:hydroxymethylpyrimidine pyrophosphatase-like HAD family hydrolase